MHISKQELKPFSGEVSKLNYPLSLLTSPEKGGRNPAFEEGKAPIMAFIRATCSDCGDVELRSHHISLRRCIDTQAATYLFRCPQCSMTEVRNADPDVVEILTSAGVGTEKWKLPAELNERPLGPPICHDDLIDFHLGVCKLPNGSFEEVVMAACGGDK